MQQRDLLIPILAGELILIHGGEIFRAEQTVTRIAKALGADQVDHFVTPTGLFVSISLGGATQTFVRSVRSRSYNMAAIVEINDLSRRFCVGELTPATMTARLEALRTPSMKKHHGLKMALAAGFGGLGFAFILGLRSPLALCYATLNGFLVSLILDFISAHIKVPAAMSVLLGSIFLSTLTFFYPYLGSSDQNLVNLGGLMTMLPGVTLSTAIRELTQGDLISGITRLAEAIITIIMIAAGVITAFTFLPIFLGVIRS